MAMNRRHYDQFAPPERLTLLLEAMARNDDTEADRLWGTCPRRTYSGPDLDFDDRKELAFDLLSVVCIDLRGLMGKLDVMHWAIENVRYFCSLHHITAEMAFLDGDRWGRGQPQMPFFHPNAGRKAANVEADAATQEHRVAEAEPETAAADLPAADPPSEFEQRLESVAARSERATESILRVLGRTCHDVARELAAVWQAFERFCGSRAGVSAETMLRAWQFPLYDDLIAMLMAYAHAKPDPAKVDQYAVAICSTWDRRFSA